MIKEFQEERVYEENSKNYKIDPYSIIMFK